MEYFVTFGLGQVAYFLGRPEPEENPLGAWYWRCSIQGAEGGPLSGKKIAIKDNVCVAGVPMMNGTVTLEGFVPATDATIVTRILDAGGEIVGKAVCDSLCFSGGSHTSDTRLVLNPHDHSRSLNQPIKAWFRRFVSPTRTKKEGPLEDARVGV
jgi:Amidase